MHFYAVKSSYEKLLRFSTLLSLVLFCIAAASQPASSDQLAPLWQQAREKWNTVGDKAVAGDQNALFELFKTVEDCQRQMACASLLANVGATKDQIEAASAAANLGWMHRFGHVVKKDIRKAYEYYHFAADKDSPMGLHNMGEFAESGEVPGTKKILETAIIFYERAAALGLAASAIRLGNIYLTHGKKDVAARYYGQALQLNPSTVQKRNINANLDNTGYKIVNNAQGYEVVPIDRAVAQATPKPIPNQAQPAQPQPPKTPTVRPEIISQGNWCMGDSAIGEENRSVLRANKRNLDKWKADLKDWGQKLNVYYNVDVARNPSNYQNYKEDFDRFEQDQREYNRDVREYQKQIANEMASREAHKEKCSLSISRAEHQNLCSADANNPWCKRYKFDN